ncbi:hypothetical protein TIFTF001_000147 [Ficus carica]|uniref:Uncharacterized protein n=1 Tax=Ficus carica TaxID=3494 RepID=A0AA87YWC0_FICCA|nr:hypothetical protein TIFTF001_000147 [Ficus carica]
MRYDELKLGTRGAAAVGERSRCTEVSENAHMGSGSTELC